MPSRPLRRRVAALLLSLGAAGAPGAAVAGPAAGPSMGAALPQLDGPRSSAVDLWRPGPGGTKLYVEAELGDGVRRMFLLDTGAGVSVLTAQAAAELGLRPGPPEGELVGLGGSVAYSSGVVEAVQIGDFTLHDVSFALGVPGLPDTAGLVPIDGILGNNVWGDFQLAIDYPANVLELHRPGTLTLPAGAVPMFFDGEHARAALTLQVEIGGAPVRQTLSVEIDTGARGLLLSGPAPRPLEAAAVEGEEPIYGIGAGDDLPASNFLRTTRRIPLQAAEIGGVPMGGLRYATWINFAPSRAHIGPQGLPGLLGHEGLSAHRVIFDFPAQRFALSPPLRAPREQDIHEWALRARRSSAGPRARQERALWLAALDRRRAAARQLRAALRRTPEDIGARVMLARLHRDAGALERAEDLLGALSPGQLVDAHEIVAAVNTAWLRGAPAEGLRLARAAVAARPETSEAWVAVADAARVSGNFAEAREALREANAIDQNPDGHLIRRAWIASEEGDAWGAAAHLSRLLELYPHSGMTLGVFASIAEASGAGAPAPPPALPAVFSEQLQIAAARMHQNDGPLDFLTGAWAATGAPERAAATLQAGVQRDCAGARAPDARWNCEAWYLALAGAELPRARALADRALGVHPDRADYLDTLATLYEAEGRLPEAADAARAAALRSPDELYLLWQASRRGQASAAARPAAPPAAPSAAPAAPPAIRPSIRPSPE